MGQKIYTEYISIEKQDNLFDIQKKITNTEMKILKDLFQNKFNLNNLINLKTNIPINKKIDENVSLKFDLIFREYKTNYKNILNLHTN